jgi:ribosomal protein S18 acetylase RimI-like enzyme
MNKRNFKIRAANLEDAESIFNIQKITWLDTYPNSKFDIHYSDIEKRFNAKDVWLKKIKKRLESKQKGSQDWIAYDGQSMCGWANARREGNEDSIGAIYVLPKYQGLGIGSLLLENILKSYANSREIWLEVAVYNNQAIKFYEKFEFKVIKGSESTHEIVKGKHIPTFKMKLSKLKI